MHRNIILLALLPLLFGNGQDPETEAHDLLVRVVCTECKGCPRTERQGIIFAALNRAEQPGWWGAGLRGVLEAPGQFATPDMLRCSDDLPTAPKRADGYIGWSPGMLRQHARLMSEIEEDAWDAMHGEIEDPVGGATYFHARRLGDLWPHLREIQVPSYWRHRFYQR
jgi:hypothetical protein